MLQGLQVWFLIPEPLQQIWPCRGQKHFFPCASHDVTQVSAWDWSLHLMKEFPSASLGCPCAQMEEMSTWSRLQE